uniref:GPI-anchor transamidase n=2 Tax=Sarcophilus harrisii TaxID=9305 RepID=G3VQR1_SARHA
MSEGRVDAPSSQLPELGPPCGWDPGQQRGARTRGSGVRGRAVPQGRGRVGEAGKGWAWAGPSPTAALHPGFGSPAPALGVLVPDAASSGPGCREPACPAGPAPFPRASSLFLMLLPPGPSLLAPLNFTGTSCRGHLRPQPFWFNYRHVANTLSVYRSVKRLGIPDSHIVLMLADDMACNPRNPKPATVFSHKNMELNVYGDDVEVDYRSYEVTVENFLRVLTGRVPPSTPRSKRLLSDDRSNILIYMTGHGGNGFLKFQDSEEITNVELADAFEQMWQKRRYHEMLFIIDTCQGASMYERFYSPNVMALASSQVGEDSLSHQPDLAIGVHLMDRYTFYVLEFLEEIHPASQANMNDLFQVCPKSLCVSTPGHRTDLFQRNPQNVLITDFFGSVRKVEITTERVALNHLKCQKDEELTEPLNYAEQLPVAQIIHQKPKQKEWHPPGGFILGLWALILMVFFKTYGIKHMKYVF